MIAWNDYLNELIQVPDTIDGIDVSYDEGKNKSSIPAIVKSSILMLDKMMQTQGHRHIIVFPERENTVLLFSLMRAIHNISTGRIEKKYTVDDFKVGDKLKLGNAVVEFLGISDMDGKKYMQIHLSDTDSYYIPVERAPIFQKTDTRRPLSGWLKFNSERKSLEESNQLIEESGTYLSHLKKYKTHMSSSVYYVSSVTGVKEQLANMRFCDEKLSDYLLIGQANYAGMITNLGVGQMAGIPAIVLSPDLYAVAASIDNGNPIQSVIIDISNMNLIISQMDMLDELLEKKIPVIFVTDTANSLDLTELVSRKFNVWRWDKGSITKELYSHSNTTINYALENCVKQNVQYIKVVGNEISESAKILAKYRWKTQEQSVQIMDMYGKLTGLSFDILRETVPTSDVEVQLKANILDECKSILEHERSYITISEYDDYDKVINNYRHVFSYGYKLNKHDALLKIFEENRGKKICLLISDHGSKAKIKNYWMEKIQKYDILLDVLYPSEYYAVSKNKYDLTIIVGWLKRAIMRKAIFSYHTKSYIVLLYDYESRWKNHDAKQWKQALDKSDNKRTIEHAFNSKDVVISTTTFQTEENSVTTISGEEIALEDELEEIDVVLRENRFKRYVRTGQRVGNNIVEAIPINFVGGYIAFYQTGHEVVSVTKIILQESDKIDSVTPDKLHNGDFVIIRESDKDIIREMADLILKKNGQRGYRDLARKWREVIEIELLFVTPKQFYESLVEAGFTKGFPTVKRWIENDNVIAPGQIEDLQYIANVTQNQVLTELMEEIFEAARIVRAAHIQAGRVLSDMLKTKIVEELKQYGKIDPFNIWEPIEIDVDGIGTAKILKIIDVGTPVQVDVSDTNRLIEE